MTEAELVRQAKRGDMDAYAALVKLHERFVYNLALRSLGNSEDVADAAQDAFVRAWMGLPQFRGDSQFRTWLYRIVINLCIPFPAPAQRSRRAYPRRIPRLAIARDCFRAGRAA